MWDQRYSEDGHAYGTEPNEFLASVRGSLPASGAALCLAAGQGRNAVYLAGLGLDVTAVDRSGVGLRRAAELAAERGLKLKTVAADLESYPIEVGSLDVITAIFCHLPPAIRGALHRRAVAGLRLGGVFVLEAYGKAQLGRGTGGPPGEPQLFDLAELRAELAGLDFELIQEIDRDVVEGRYHTGGASVVQVLGIKR